MNNTASPVEQHASLTAQDALAAIETFEIVGESNDSREPNDEDRFILTEFIAHAFGGYPVEQDEAAPADWPHIANEWADAACNGVQWIKNIRDGVSTAADALAEMETNMARIRACGNLHQREPVMMDERAVLIAQARRDAFNEAASVDAKVIAMLTATGKVRHEDVDAALAKVAALHAEQRKEAPADVEPEWYFREVHAGYPEFNKTDEFSDGQGGGMALYTRAPQLEPAVADERAGAEGALREALGRTRGALYAIAKTYDDGELRTRALEAYGEAFDVPAQAPAQATE
ncbi:hypothetical protein G3N57_04235 [Paraburkholderia sp. Se-20369]|nr:hypothetical protein [Paraburkholderia sp. Se-20369]